MLFCDGAFVKSCLVNFILIILSYFIKNTGCHSDHGGQIHPELWFNPVLDPEGHISLNTRAYVHHGNRSIKSREMFECSWNMSIVWSSIWEGKCVPATICGLVNMCPTSHQRFFQCVGDDARWVQLWASAVVPSEIQQPVWGRLAKMFPQSFTVSNTVSIRFSSQLCFLSQAGGGSGLHYPSRVTSLPVGRTFVEQVHRPLVTWQQ